MNEIPGLSSRCSGTGLRGTEFEVGFLGLNPVKFKSMMEDKSWSLECLKSGSYVCTAIMGEEFHGMSWHSERWSCGAMPKPCLAFLIRWVFSGLKIHEGVNWLQVWWGCLLRTHSTFASWKWEDRQAECGSGFTMLPLAIEVCSGYWIKVFLQLRWLCRVRWEWCCDANRKSSRSTLPKQKMYGLPPCLCPVQYACRVWSFWSFGMRSLRLCTEVGKAFPQTLKVRNLGGFRIPRLPRKSES